MMNCQRLNWMRPKGGEAIPPRIALYLNFLLIEELYIRSAFLFSGTNIMAKKCVDTCCKHCQGINLCKQGKKKQVFRVVLSSRCATLRRIVKAMIKIVVVEVVVIVLQLFSKSSSRYGTARQIEFVMIKVVVDYYYLYRYSYCCNGRSSG